MNKLLIDTSGFFSLYDEDEKNHSETVRFYENSLAKITTSYVLAEYTPLAQIRRVPRSEIIKFSSLILEDKDVEIVWVDEILHRQAVKLMQKREDKNYSLCDAASFVVMRERGIMDALTTDKHFKQEGFRRLLLP
jgi:predicted nucleic acid-binding protein